MSDSDDNELALSAEATAALLEFYAEQQEQAEQLQNDASNINEDWVAQRSSKRSKQLSQFWYDDATATSLANEALRLSGPKGAIACISCPTVYRKLKAAKDDPDKQWSAVQLRLLEYDRRFASYAGTDFVHYDYNEPLNVSQDVYALDFDVVIVDPPFLAEECLTKTSETVKRLTTRKIILCTGAVMEDIACQLLDLKVCKFHPKHEKNLGNQFKCYANYNLDSYI